MACDLSHEASLHARGYHIVCGIDEAGRGPLAGPVSVAAVVLPHGFSHPWLNDSKKLSARRRETIYTELLATPGLFWHCEVIDAETIDTLNILRATHTGMRRCALALPVPPDAALIDGLPVPDFPIPHFPLVGGDALSLSIAAASIIAKVTRDRLMLEADKIYPAYGFAQHKGYGTKQHLQALEQWGPCPIHRRSFAPVAQALLPFKNA